MPDDPDDITKEELEEIAARVEAEGPLSEEEILAWIDRLNREAEELERARSEGAASAEAEKPKTQ